MKPVGGKERGTIRARRGEKEEVLIGEESGKEGRTRRRKKQEVEWRVEVV